MGTEKTVPVDEPEEVAVALRQLNGRNRGNAFETGKAFVVHSATMIGRAEMGQTLECAVLGK
jgi:hypothetical protein